MERNVQCLEQHCAGMDADGFLQVGKYNRNLRDKTPLEISERTLISLISCDI